MQTLSGAEWYTLVRIALNHLVQTCCLVHMVHSCAYRDEESGADVLSGAWYTLLRIAIKNLVQTCCLVHMAHSFVRIAMKNHLVQTRR